jgi:hypothetical protein
VCYGQVTWESKNYGYSRIDDHLPRFLLNPTVDTVAHAINPIVSIIIHPSEYGDFC